MKIGVRRKAKNGKAIGCGAIYNINEVESCRVGVIGIYENTIEKFDIDFRFTK
ncbi:MAG: hypothetical protein U9R01_01175 [candidate division WOR-3 bacterium]|nr:hypothetical protein [candidate division WOR-3 bacterium]